MATQVPRLQDETYVNWLRCSLGLLYLKEGLESFIDKRVADFLEELRKHMQESYSWERHVKSVTSYLQASSSGRTFTTCSLDDIQKYDQSKWMKAIMSYHIDGASPNTACSSLKPQLWPAYPWEVAKCFLPIGYENINSARDADVGAMLTLLNTCKFMWKFITNSRLVDEVLDIHNRLMQARDLTVSDDQLKQDADKMAELLQKLERLSPTETETFQRTIDNINQLSAKTMDMSHRMELTALNSRRQAIDRELVCLRDKCSDFEQTHQDLNATEESMSLYENYQKEKAALNQASAARDKLDELISNNELVEDMASLSNVLEEQNQMLENGQPDADAPNAERIKSWNEQCKDIQHYLIDLYENRYAWEKPMTSYEEQFPSVYVQPAVKLIREKNTHLTMVQVKQQQQLTYQQIFFSHIDKCRHIYITGDTGTGKTTFCNQMVLNWCKAVQNIQDGSDSSEDIMMLSTFRFLFHIDMSKANEIYHVQDMIKEQLLYTVAPSIDVSSLMKSESCLIVLDGLDRWTCPAGVTKSVNVNKELPNRNTMIRTCVFLTAVRNWKFQVMQVKNAEIDKHIDLCGLDEDSSKELAQKMFDYLNRKTLTRRNVDDFYTAVDKKSLGTFITLPFLLIHLINLWYFGKDFSNSQVQLYCSMLDILFEYSVKNLPQKTSENLHTSETTLKKLPDCFSTKYYCQSHAEILHFLAQLAYKALFNKQKEEALIFKFSSMEYYGLSPSDIKLCVECGILSQTKEYNNYTGRYKRFSFLNKKIQEFLAAFYIATFDPVENLIEFCSTLDVMLDLSQVWLFVAGLRPDITRQMLEHLKLLTEDKQVQMYRQTLGGQSLIQDIQTCIVDCVIEGRYNNYIYNICLEDFYITKETISPVEHLLSCTQSSKVKSVYMNTSSIDGEHLASITSHLRKCRYIQKLHLTDPRSGIPGKTVADIVDRNCSTLACLSVYSDIAATDKFVTAICNSSNKRLVALRLFNVKLTHKQKEQIIKKVSKSCTIGQLVLAFHCTDHDIRCRARIDLSAMTQIQKLELWGMSLDNLQSVSDTVQEVVLWNVTLSVTSLLEFVHHVSQTEQDMTVRLGNVTVTEAIETRVDLQAVLRGHFGAMLTVCLYNDSKNTWCIDFHTSCQ